MTVSITTNKQVFAGDDANTSFPFNFTVHSSGDVNVYHQDTDGVITGPLTVATQYTISIGVDDTGTVTYPVSGDALATGENLIVMREIDLDQSVDLTTGGPYSPSEMETALDKIVFQIQQLNERIDSLAKPDADAYPLSNGDLEIEKTSNTTLTFKLKGSDGTVRSGTITLS